MKIKLDNKPTNYTLKKLSPIFDKHNIVTRVGMSSFFHTIKTRASENVNFGSIPSLTFWKLDDVIWQGLIWLVFKIAVAGSTTSNDVKIRFHSPWKNTAVATIMHQVFFRQKRAPAKCIFNFIKRSLLLPHLELFCRPIKLAKKCWLLPRCKWAFIWETNWCSYFWHQ